MGIDKGIMVMAPLFVMQTKTKKFYLNLNAYRNTHFQVLNKAKIEYKKIIRNQLIDLPEFSAVALRYTLYPKTKRLCDLDNILSIHAKFFQDALVELSKIEEDSYIFIPQSIYQFGNIDKLNPRVEIEILPIIKETKND